MNRTRRTAIALAAVSVAGLGVGASTASAAPQPMQIRDYSAGGAGVPKGNVTYFASKGLVCATTVTGARTSIFADLHPNSSPGSAVLLSDQGGDDAPTCAQVPAGFAGQLLSMSGRWTGSGSGTASNVIYVNG